MMVVIVGPTASGKTDLALRLAEKYDGEIICADSRTIYRGMDIGTAKPTMEERKRVPHHLLDIVEPGDNISAAAFKKLAIASITDIESRGRMPFLVGGSGLYIDSVLFDFQFPAEADMNRRQQLEAMDDTSLQELLEAEDLPAYKRVDLANRRRVIRAIEIVGQAPLRRNSVIDDALVIGLHVSKEIAHERIQNRVKLMLEQGFLDEVLKIGTTFGWDSSALDVIGYKACKGVVLGTKSREEGMQDFVRGDMALYKKQLTWFKRNSYINWLDGSSGSSVYQLACELVVGFNPSQGLL